MDCGKTEGDAGADRQGSGCNKLFHRLRARTRRPLASRVCRSPAIIGVEGSRDSPLSGLAPPVIGSGELVNLFNRDQYAIVDSPCRHPPIRDHVIHFTNADRKHLRSSFAAHEEPCIQWYSRSGGRFWSTALTFSRLLLLNGVSCGWR